MWHAGVCVQRKRSEAKRSSKICIFIVGLPLIGASLKLQLIIIISLRQPSHIQANKMACMRCRCKGVRSQAFKQNLYFHSRVAFDRGFPQVTVDNHHTPDERVNAAHQCSNDAGMIMMPATGMRNMHEIAFLPSLAPRMKQKSSRDTVRWTACPQCI